MNITTKTLALAATFAAALAATTTAAHAAHVTTLVGGTVHTIPALNLFSAGPQTIAPGIIWTSQTGSAVFGWTSGYGFSGNGYWSGQSMIGSNDDVSAMRISFDAPVSGVLAFLNYAPGYGTPVISAYDSGDKLLDSYTLNFSVGNTNGGEFHGFEFSQPSISYVTLSGAYIGASSVQVTSAVPEAGSIAMVLGGLGVVAAIARRRKMA